ncbi:MAG: septum site-determining protein MinD [Clostridia bacterium]|nr:septum site-determining protein MinD [Clostridia bacterium]
MGKAWIIASGKGGVGKSTVTAATASALAQAGSKVCIVDADVGLRDQDAILGLENRVVYDLIDLCRHDCELTDALMQHPDFPGLHLLPAAQFARAKDLDPRAFRKVIDTLKAQFDHVLIDCPAGIGRGLRGLMLAACDETVLVCTPDDVCIRNAERAASVIRDTLLPSPWLIVNRLDAELIRAGEMYAADVVAQTLDLPLLGEVPEDPMVMRALVRHLPLIACDCEARHALHRIARRMNGGDAPLPGYGTGKLPLLKRLFHRKLKEVKTL